MPSIDRVANPSPSRSRHHARPACGRAGGLVVVLALSLTALVGCSTSSITRVGGGPAIGPPMPRPSNDAELKEWCEYGLDRMTPDGRQRVISECRNAWNRTLAENRRQCRDDVNSWAKGLPRVNTQAERRVQQEARDSRVDQCMRAGHDFPKTMRAARQFEEFKRIEQPAGYGAFIQAHGNNDLIGLVAEAQARYAPLCGRGVAVDATSSDARAWLDQFQRVGPSHCVAQQRMARQVLRRDELRQAAGSVEKLDAFAARHAAEDPEGLVPKARSQALEIVREQERQAFDRARSWAELAAFVEAFQPSKDARYTLAPVAQERIAEARSRELARVQATPADALEQRLDAEASQWPAEWREIVEVRLIEQSTARADVPSGLRMWRLTSRVDVLADAVARMKPEDDHDEAVEAQWKRALYPAAFRDVVAAYGRKRDSFRGLLLAYSISNAQPDLRQAGLKAGTRAEKAQVEYAVIQRIGPARFFTTSGRLSAGGNSVDINQTNLIIGHAILSETASLLDWQVKPDSGLMPLQHGRYRLTVKLSLTLQRKTTASILGITNVTNDQSVMDAQQTVVLESGSGYAGQGSQRFKWTPTVQMGAAFGIVQGKVETTGMSVKVEVVSVDRLEI